MKTGATQSKHWIRQCFWRLSLLPLVTKHEFSKKIEWAQGLHIVSVPMNVRSWSTHSDGWNYFCLFIPIPVLFSSISSDKNVCCALVLHTFGYSWKAMSDGQLSLKLRFNSVWFGFFLCKWRSKLIIVYWYWSVKWEVPVFIAVCYLNKFNINWIFNIEVLTQVITT